MWFRGQLLVHLTALLSCHHCSLYLLFCLTWQINIIDWLITVAYVAIRKYCCTIIVCACLAHNTIHICPQGGCFWSFYAIDINPNFKLIIFQPTVIVVLYSLHENNWVIWVTIQFSWARKSTKRVFFQRKKFLHKSTRLQRTKNDRVEFSPTLTGKVKSCSKSKSHHNIQA